MRSQERVYPAGPVVDPLRAQAPPSQWPDLFQVAVRPPGPVIVPPRLHERPAASAGMADNTIASSAATIAMKIAVAFIDDPMCIVLSAIVKDWSPCEETVAGMHFSHLPAFKRPMTFVFRHVSVCNSASFTLAFQVRFRELDAMSGKNDASIFICEDDEEIQRLVREMLVREGYSVEVAASADALDHLFTLQKPDLVILDLMLPGEDGLSICRRLRSRDGLPILMLTAKADPIDRVVGLEMGADDYLVKPFNPRELLARIRALLRRSRGTVEKETNRRRSFAGLLMDLDARQLATEAGQSVPLTAAEFELLACFVERPRRVLTRDQLLDWTRGRMADPFDRSIDMTISRLRKKISAVAPGVELFSTVRNNGYLFVPAVKQLNT